MAALRPGLSFCEVDETLVFLDIRQDRYFCLTAPAEQAFRAVIALGHSRSGRSPRASPLLAPLLAHAPAAPLAACAAPCAPEASLLDADFPSAGTVAVLSAIVSVSRARFDLAVRGLGGSLAGLDRQRRAAGPSDPDRDRLIVLMAPFMTMTRLASTRNACLPHSLAVAHQLVGGGQPAQLVFGVRLGPFAAHCWVQVESLVVNDRIDTVRTFTPILVA